MEYAVMGFVVCKQFWSVKYYLYLSIYVINADVVFHQAACKCVYHDLQAALLLVVWLLVDL